MLHSLKKKIPNCLPVALVAALVGLTLAPVASANPNIVYQRAYNIQVTTNDLINFSYQMGDGGFAVNDLINLNRAAQQFAYSLNYNDYQNLRYYYQVSRQSWGYLRVWQYEQQRFSWIDNDMQTINYYYQNPGPGPGPGPGNPKVITVTGTGAGGTTVGDKNAACDRAQERAIDDAANSCSQHHGWVTSSQASSCSCKSEGGSKKKINCRANATATCKLN